jgi:hypothetical protein
VTSGFLKKKRTRVKWSWKEIKSAILIQIALDETQAAEKGSYASLRSIASLQHTRDWNNGVVE